VRRVWASETLANGAGVSRSWIETFSRGNAPCAHKKCVKSASTPDNRIEDGCENERNKPRIRSPFFERLQSGPALFFQSQGLKVGGSTARWVFVVAAILDGSQMCVWSRLHTTQLLLLLLSGVYRIDQFLKPQLSSRFVPKPERGHGLGAGNRRSDPHDRTALLYFMYSRFGPNSPGFGSLCL
jgi:hypothetical protein